MTDRAEGITMTNHDVPEAYAPDEPEQYVPVAWQAITSLVVGIVTVLFAFRLGALGFVAIAFGADALWRTNRGLRTGKGMAIAGIILGGVALAVAVVSHFA